MIIITKLSPCCGVTQAVTQAVINKPETNTTLQHINVAYGVLSRTALRREYDRVIRVCGDNIYDETPCEFELSQNFNSLTLNIAPKLFLVWMEICTAFYSTKPTNKGLNGRQINPLTAKLFNLNFHPLEVVSR